MAVTNEACMYEGWRFDIGDATFAATSFHWDGATWTAPSAQLPREVGAV